MTADGIGGDLRSRRSWLFDLDGTLVDSRAAHERAFRQALEEIAPELLDRFEYRGGTSTVETVERLTRDPALTGEITTRKQTLYRTAVADGKIQAFAGAIPLLEILRGEGAVSYLVTSGSRGSVEKVVASHALMRFLAGVLTGDDVPINKPDPAIYREARRRWRLRNDDIVVVEDSPFGVSASLGAGLFTVQVHAKAVESGAVGIRTLVDLASLLEGMSNA